MNQNTHGLEAGMRVVEADADVCVEGVISYVDIETHSAWIEWDNGHNGDVDLDEIIPVGGW